MIKRFLNLEGSIRKAMVDLKGSFTVSDSEIKVLKEFIEILNFLEEAMLKLGERETNLLTSECIFKYVSNILRLLNSQQSITIEKCIADKLEVRKNKGVLALLILLKFGSCMNDEIQNLFYKLGFDYESCKFKATCLFTRMFFVQPGNANDPNNAINPNLVNDSNSLCVRNVLEHEIKKFKVSEIQI